MTLRLSVPPLGDVLFCHATPRNENDIFLDSTAEELLSPAFEPAQAAVVVCGHTHMQFDRIVGKTRIVNAGSVGMPFGPAGADWLLLGPGVDLRHTNYDLDAAAERIRGSGYPAAEEFAARYILNPPSAADMVALFAKHELKP
jgi:diadenosine tetraphosphatase ApaH/serine/threonine PP2A family protein phosphatase